MKEVSWKIIGLTFLLAGFGQWAVADDDDDHKGKQDEQAEPIELLINFQISGLYSGNEDGKAIYTINGPGYAPDDIDDEYGEISDEIKEDREVATLAGGKITFPLGSDLDGVVNFSCLPTSCTITFKDGSVLTSPPEDLKYPFSAYNPYFSGTHGPYVNLDGRAINKWGPIANSPDNDPVNGIFATRILGCGGLVGMPGKGGRFDGMVGSICFNGQLNFSRTSPVLTGSSKCTIVLHTPADGFEIPAFDIPAIVD